jgi:hypothetical protein
MVETLQLNQELIELDVAWTNQIDDMKKFQSNVDEIELKVIQYSTKINLKKSYQL